MEKFLACFKILFWHMLWGDKEIMKSLRKAGFWELPNTSNWSCKPRKVTICGRNGVVSILLDLITSQFLWGLQELTETFVTLTSKPFPYLYKHSAWIEHAVGMSCLQICLSLCVCVCACARARARARVCACAWSCTCVIYETIVFCVL